MPRRINNDTGICIRVQIDGKWESADIGDWRVSTEQVRAWLETLTATQLVRTVLLLLYRSTET